MTALACVTVGAVLVLAAQGAQNAWRAYVARTLAEMRREGAR